MKTYSDVKAAIDKLQARAEQLRQAEKAGVVSRIREAISVYGITAAELGLSGGGSRGAARAGAKSEAPTGKVQVGVAKYRDPATGKTWTGRGKPPLWIVGAKDRDAFLINGGGRPAADTAAPKRGGRGGKRKAAAAAAGSTVGVAKYRDPATGKTWTGRGKPPLWIAGAKDRQAFLIDGGSSAAPAAAESRRGRKAAAGRPS